MKTVYLAVLVIASLALVATPANANLLSNSGFETNDLSNWTATGVTVPPSSWGPGPHSGSYGAATWGATGNIGEAYQTVNVTANTAYAFTIYGARDTAGGGAEGTSAYYMALRWYAGANPLTTDNGNLGIMDTSYAQYTLNATAPATATSVRVVFGANGTDNRAGFWDDADFDTTGGDPIPEPTSMLLLGSGLVGLLGFTSRKR